MKFTKEEKFLARIILIVLIGLVVRCYGLFVQQQTIESAELIGVNDYTQEYSLSFNGEIHTYNGNWEVNIIG